MIQKHKRDMVFTFLFVLTSWLRLVRSTHACLRYEKVLGDRGREEVKEEEDWVYA